MTPLLLALLLSAPAAAVQPAQARPGDAVVITVTGAGAAPSGALLDRPLRFYPAGADRWQAVAPLPSEAAPGPVVVALDAAGEQVPAAFEVVPFRFRSTTLSVPPKFLEPPASARARIAADSAAIAEAYAQPFGPPRYRGAMIRPSRAETSGRFGDQRVYNGKVSGAHYGLDLADAAGAPVLAAADGEVVLARDCYMSGWTVILSHGAGVYSSYLHQSKVEVRPGQLVRQGQRLGRVGSTGRSTGPHLHWGVKVDGLLVDPDSMVRVALDGGGEPGAAPAEPAPAAAPGPEGAPVPEPSPGPAPAPAKAP